MNPKTLWRRINDPAREIIIVLSKPPTRVVIVNDIVGQKIADYLTASWELQTDNSMTNTRRQSEAYRNLVNSSLDPETIAAVLNEARVSVKEGRDAVFIGSDSLPALTTGTRHVGLVDDEKKGGKVNG